MSAPVRLAIPLLALLFGCSEGPRPGSAQVSSAAAGATTSSEPKATVVPGVSNVSALMLTSGQAAAGVTTQAPDDHGDDAVAATLTLAPGDSASGVLERTGDRDWFVLDLPAGQPCEIGFSCFGMARVVLVAADGVTELEVAPPGTSSLSHTSASGGKAFLRVETDSGRDLYYDIDVR
jgi:hypothetical protein